MTEKTHVVWHEHAVSRPRGCVLWFTGLSGSGKSTIANQLDRLLFELGARSFVLDGDNIRHGLNAGPERLIESFGESSAKRFGLGFSAEDRAENIRRIGCVAEIFCSAGLLAITAFVSPYRADRDRVRHAVEAGGTKGDFVEVFVDTPLAICEQRDPKGLYKKARAGEISGFTGIDDPYEPPLAAEIVLAGDSAPADVLAGEVVDYLRKLGKLDQGLR
jgi:adenylylsulfate kinase